MGVFRQFWLIEPSAREVADWRRIFRLVGAPVGRGPIRLQIGALSGSARRRLGGILQDSPT